MGTTAGVQTARLVKLSPRARTGYVVDEATGCWNWTGFIRPDGYGKAWDPRRRAVGRAHRVVYETLRGPVDDALDLDHTCRNRRCVNPDHLDPVTRGENLRRGAGAKLTWDAVREIRRRYAGGGVTTRELGAAFGISNRSCSQITMGRSWPDSAYTPPVAPSRRSPFPRD